MARLSWLGIGFLRGIPDPATSLSRPKPQQCRLALLNWQPPPANECATELIADSPSAGPARPPIPGAWTVCAGGPARVRQLPTGAGFTGIEIDPIQAPMWFGADVDDAHAFAPELLG